MRKLRIAIIGAGASGILAVIKMREAGFDDLTVFEKASELGGTWRDNRYPGLTCDVPSHLYRYEFAPNPDWTHVCSPGPEILDYFKTVADKYDVNRSIRYSSEVTKAKFIGSQWQIDTVQGSQGAFDAVLVAAGVLHHPVYPEIAGLDSFNGPSFHTARWPDNLSLQGKRVGIIGTGSTATQIVSAIVDQVASLRLFQRTAQWVMPQPNPPISEEKKAQYRANPDHLRLKYERLALSFNSGFAAALVGDNPQRYSEMARACLDNLESNVSDPVLREKLRPDYKVGCKRLIMSDRFYQAISQPQADVITDRIELIEPRGVRTAGNGVCGGVLHELDVLVLATGFDTHRFVRPMQVHGRDGRTLDELWSKSNEGYLGVTVPHLPNWFMIGGPNSPIGNFSWLMTSENQLCYAMQLIEALRDGRCQEISPKPAAVRAFNDAIKAKLPDTVWATGCNSWYIDKNGNIASWPWNYEKFQADMRSPVFDDYEMH